MYGVVPTVKVKREGGRGYRIINESAFDPSRHELYESPSAAPLPADTKGAVPGGSDSAPCPDMAEAIRAAEALGSPRRGKKWR